MTSGSDKEDFVGRDTTITRPIPAQGFAQGARVPTQGWDSGHVYPLHQARGVAASAGEYMEV